jgi:hypothetical protein
MNPLPVLLLGAAAAMPDLAQLEQMTARLAPVAIKVDTTRLSAGDRRALSKLVEAAHVMDGLFMDQLWSQNRAFYRQLQQDRTPLGKARAHYYWLNKGPWSDLDGHTAFLPGVPDRKPPGANFYPTDMSRREFESWVKSLPATGREQAEGFFTVIRRDGAGKLQAVPYSQAYGGDLERAAQLLREAASLTKNASLRRFLTLRAAAFLSNDYYASDVAWMDLDAPIEVTIGPYETYNDELFGYKAAFEAYIAVRDDAETARLQAYSGRLQEIENNLPIDARYKNPKLGGLAPIRVVNEVMAAGDGAHGVRTAAYNLPNDERVVREKGSKRIMLKNIQEAKFNQVLVPIAARVLPAAARGDLSFDSFFTHILAHELSHGIGPQTIRVDGRDTSVRKELKELYSAIEEAKADITGLFMLQYLMDHGMGGGADAERRLYTTYLASAFRSIGFGLHEAHARGMATQLNYLFDKGGFVINADNTFAVNFQKIKPAVRDLTHDLLTVEAHGDYDEAKRMLDSLAVLRPPVQKAIEGLRGIPVDIAPEYK